MELYRWLFDVRKAIVLVVTTSCSGILFFTEPPPELIFFIAPPPELFIFLEPPPELLFFIDLPLHAGAYNMSNGNEDGESVAEKDGEKQVEEEAEKNGTKEAEKDGAKEAETTPEDAEGEEEADKDGKNSESDAITADVHTPLPTETTSEEAAKEAYEVAGNEDEVGQKEGETEADKEGETEEGKTDVEDSPSTLQVME
uniref:Uncharacterized protein n=1 Tax=Brassica campestris TaxID=3711 RepID=A0A3P6AZ16_BRACM|nr:unnamed protein product [Brassica rapa]